MTVGYLDTNILIAFFDGRVSVRHAMERFSSLQLPAAAYAEFLVGLDNAAERAAMEEVIQSLFDIVHTDTAICAEAARLRRETRLKLIDALIYATARIGGGTLITLDKDFDSAWPDIYIPG